MSTTNSSPKNNPETLGPPSSFHLPGISISSESLASGTSIPPPQPSPPLPSLPKTPTKSPLRHQFSDDTSPTASMPGAFPTSPLSSPNQEKRPQTPNGATKASYSVSAYASTSPNARMGTPNSQSAKRPGGLRSFLSFRSRASPQNGTADHPSYQNSPHLENSRPASPGGSSMALSFRPSLAKKAGSFWTRRKSSLPPYSLPAFSETPTNGQSQSPATTNGKYQDDGGLKRSGQEANIDEAASPPPTLKKRMSRTFWGRESSLAMNGDNKYFAQQHQGHVNGTNKNSEEQYEEMRPGTPPPVLPEISSFVKEASLLDEDLFKNIG
ncbi:hypothetical protein MMC31_003063 [Peltigera leucophlebia]|nr:hypothetical protein [Peltigera leucophlebia]